MVSVKDDVMKENLNMNENIRNYYEELKLNYSWLTMDNETIKCSECSVDFRCDLDDKEGFLKEVESHNALHPNKLVHDSDQEFDFQEFSLTPYWQSVIKHFNWVIYKDCKFRCQICEEGYLKSKSVISTTWSCPEKMPRIIKSNAVMYSKWQRFSSHEETDNHQRALYIVNNLTELEKPLNNQAGPNSPKPNVKTRRSKVLQQVPLIKNTNEGNQASSISSKKVGSCSKDNSQVLANESDKVNDINSKEVRTRRSKGISNLANTINLKEIKSKQSSNNKSVKETKVRTQKDTSIPSNKSKVDTIKIEKESDIPANEMLNDQMNIVVQINKAEKMAGDAALLMETNETTEYDEVDESGKKKPLNKRSKSKNLNKPNVSLNNVTKEDKSKTRKPMNKCESKKSANKDETLERSKAPKTKDKSPEISGKTANNNESMDITETPEDQSLVIFVESENVGTLERPEELEMQGKSLVISKGTELKDEFVEKADEPLQISDQAEQTEESVKNTEEPEEDEPLKISEQTEQTEESVKNTEEPEEDETLKISDQIKQSDESVEYAEKPEENEVIKMSNETKNKIENIPDKSKEKDRLLDVSVERTINESNKPKKNSDSLLKIDEIKTQDKSMNMNVTPNKSSHEVEENNEETKKTITEGERPKIQLSSELFPSKFDTTNKGANISRKFNLSRKSKSVFLENLQNEKPKRKSIDRKQQITSKPQTSNISLESTNNENDAGLPKSKLKQRKSQVKRKKSGTSETYDFDAFKKAKLTSPKKNKSPIKPLISRINDPKQIINDKIEIMEKFQLSGVSKRKSNNKRLISSIDRTIKPTFVTEGTWIELVNEFVWLYCLNNRIHCFMCEEAYKKFPEQLKKTQFTSPMCVLDFKTCHDDNSFKYNRLIKHQDSLNHQTAYNLLNNIASTNLETSKNYNVNSITLIAPVEIHSEMPECLVKHEVKSLKERYPWLIVNKTNYGCQTCLDSYKSEPNDMIKSRFTDGLLEFEETETNSNFKSRIIKHSENYRHVLATNMVTSLSIFGSDKKHTRLRDGTAMKIDYRKLSLDGKPNTDTNIEEEIVKPKIVTKMSPKKQNNCINTLESKHQIKCPQCKSNFSQITDLKFHIELCDQSNNELLACPCNPSRYQFDLISKLDLHSTQEHSNDTLFHCYICSQQFHFISHLCIHMYDVHMIDWSPYNTYGPDNLLKVFQCMFCQSTFSNNLSLTDHYMNSNCHDNFKVSIMLDNCAIEQPQDIDVTNDIVEIDKKSLIDDNESVQLELIDDNDMLSSPKSKKFPRKTKTTPKLPQKTNIETPKPPILKNAITKRNLNVCRKGRKVGLNVTKKFKAGSGEIETVIPAPINNPVNLKKKFPTRHHHPVSSHILEKFKYQPQNETIEKPRKEFKVKEKPKPKVEEIKLVTTVDEKNEPPPKRAKKFAIIFHSTGSPRKPSQQSTSYSSPSKVMIQTPNADNLDENCDKEFNKASLNRGKPAFTLPLSNGNKPGNSASDNKPNIDAVTGINQSLPFMDRMKQIRQIKKLRAEKLREENLNKVTNASSDPDKNSSATSTGSTKDRCICIVCGEFFRSFTSRDQHIKAYHRQFKLFNCHLCTMHFRTHVSLRKHAQRYHADQITYAVFGGSDDQPSTDTGLDKSSKADTNVVVAKESKAAANNMVKCEICSMVFMNKAGYNLHHTAQHKKVDTKADNINDSNVAGNNVSGNTSTNLNASDNLNTSTQSNGNNVAGSSANNSGSTVTPRPRKGNEDIVKRLGLSNYETDLQSCMVCQETLDNDLEFLIHTLDHEKEVGKTADGQNYNQFACPSCCRLFFGKDGKLYLKDHYNMTHLKRPKPTCENCQTHFNSTYCYQQHLRLFKGHCTVGSGNTISDPYAVLQGEDRHAYICNRCQSLFAGQASKARFDKHLETCQTNVEKDNLQADLKIDEMDDK